MIRNQERQLSRIDRGNSLDAFSPRRACVGLGGH